MKIALSATHLVAAGVIATAFAIGFLSGPAFAGEPQADAAQFEFRFEFDRSELSNAESAKLMLDRLERKVRRHCDDGGRKPVAEHRLVSECIERTMTKSVERFGSAALAEAYKSRMGG